MAKLLKRTAAALALASAVAAAPASATIFEYEMTNGDILTIDTETQSGSWKGKNINATFTSPDFANFKGGAKPQFAATLTSLDGTRTIRGQQFTDNPKNINTSHPQKLYARGSNFNLWAWWGDPIRGGDYVKNISGFTVTEVPAPGMLGLLAIALCALGLGRRRRRGATAA